MLGLAWRPFLEVLSVNPYAASGHARMRSWVVQPHRRECLRAPERKEGVDAIHERCAVVGVTPPTPKRPGPTARFASEDRILRPSDTISQV